MIICNRRANISYEEKEMKWVIVQVAQNKYKCMHGWVGKMQENKVDKWYIHKPESVLENATHEIIWDFRIENIFHDPGQKTESGINQQEIVGSC